MASAGSAADGDLRPAAENASKTSPMRRDGCAGIHRDDHVILRYNVATVW
jgi:hypothetical protein